MYSLPQEIEVWYIIPAIRKELSIVFVKKHKLTYDKAGAILGISKAAISQYLSGKRATKFTLPNTIKKEVETAAQVMIKNPQKAVTEIEKILKTMRKNKMCCKICKKQNPEITKYCQGKPVC